MTAFASLDDLNAILGQSIDETLGELVLDLASGAIRSWTRQSFDYVEDDTISVSGNWDTILVLPERPVAAITSISVDAEELDTDSWRLDGDVLYRTARWGGPKVTVEVVYTHGYEILPDDIRGFCLRLAARWLTNPQGLRTESIGTYSVGFGGDITGALVAESEWRELGRYRIRAAAVPL